MAFLDCPRGHRVDSETRVFAARAGLVRWILPLESERLKNPTATARMVPSGNGLFARDAQAACGFK
jgi:hypothetical protein